jgi:hypothetical protein
MARRPIELTDADQKLFTIVRTLQKMRVVREVWFRLEGKALNRKQLGKDRDLRLM